MARTQNANVGRRAGARKGVVVVTVVVPNAAAAVDQNVFVVDQKYRVVSIEEAHSGAGSDPGTVAVWVLREGGQALTTAYFNLKGVVNTVVGGTLRPADAERMVGEGERIRLLFVGTQTAVAGIAVTIKLIPASGAGQDNNNRRYWISEV